MFNYDFENDNELYKEKINNLFDKNIFDDKKEIIIRLGKLPLVYNLYEGNIINADIFIHKSTINHFLRKHKFIDRNIVLNLYEYIVNPLCLFYGSEPNTILSILDYKSSDNYNLQTPIFLNYKNNNIFIKGTSIKCEI